MNDILALTIALAALAVSILGYFRSRYWAKRAEAAAEHAEKYAERARELRDAANIRLIKSYGR